MNSAPEGAGPIGTPQDEWNRAARAFYDSSARDKQGQARYRRFVSAYRRVGRLIGLSKDKSLLDVGCGCGELAQALRPLAASYCGLDISLESLQVARIRNPGALFLECDVSGELPKGPYDCVAAISSLEFCYEREKTLRNIRSVLSPEGRFYLEVRNGGFLLAGMPSGLHRLLEKAGLLAPYPASGFRDLSSAEWSALLERSGFEILEVTRSCRPLFYGGMMTLTKNALIRLIRAFFPLRLNYMIGFVCRKSMKP